MPPLRQILAVLALGASLASQTAVAAECPYPGKVVFAGLNWESGMFTTDLLRYVLEKGYGCETDALPGNTVTMENALRQNDIQVTGEQWAGRSPVWRAAEEAGEVFSVGETVKGATEGWWVPEYLVKGDPQRGIEAKAPELRSVADLPRYKALFRDPEEARQGAFLQLPDRLDLRDRQQPEAQGLQVAGQLHELPHRHRPGAGCGDQCGLPARRAGAFLLLVADSVDGPFQAGATGRAAVQREGLGHPVRSEEPRPHRFPLVAGEDHHWRFPRFP